MISVNDPNAPVALVYVDPAAPAEPALARQLSDALDLEDVPEPIDASAPDVDVLGLTMMQQHVSEGDRLLSVDVPLDGDDLLGDWLVDDLPIIRRYVIVEAGERSRLIVVTPDGDIAQEALIEMPVASGRRFGYATKANDDDYLLIADDGSLHVGDGDGVRATVDAR